jgi:hypothetical protein
MSKKNNVGDLVHIPQASLLLSYKNTQQEAIPFDSVRLKEPNVAIVAGKESQGYVPVLWNGEEWSVRTADIYTIKEL